MHLEKLFTYPLIFGTITHNDLFKAFFYQKKPCEILIFYQHRHRL